MVSKKILTINTNLTKIKKNKNIHITPCMKLSKRETFLSLSVSSDKALVVYEKILNYLEA